MNCPEQRTFDDWRNGGKRATAELCSRLEQDVFPTMLVSVLDEAVRRPLGITMGVTGPPGAGKSTLIGALIRHYRGNGQTVGVIAVDPSSRLTGGAILGDRTRFTGDGYDSQLFVRSMAARERLGGLAPATGAALFYLRAVHDITIVETVGVGQSETDIARLVDLVLMCTPPAAGDRLQFIKSGLLEIPDVVALTKSDLGAVADHAYAELRSGLRSAAAGGKPAPLVRVSSRDSASLVTLIETLQEIEHAQKSSGRFAARRVNQSRHWLEDAIRDQYGRRGLAMISQDAPVAAPFQHYQHIRETLEAGLSRAF